MRPIIAFAAVGLLAVPAWPDGLRPVVDPSHLPDLDAAVRNRTDLLVEALDRSLAWFDRPESRALFPFDDPPVTHARAREGVAVMRELLTGSANTDAFVDRVLERFEVYESIGHDGRGTVRYTAYYAPEHQASPVRTRRFRYAIYRPPQDHRDTHRATRREIEAGDLLGGRELAWLADPLSVYLVQVNGSARLRMPGGDVMHVGHVATNGHTYTSLGRLLIEEGLIAEDELSMQRIREVHRRDPETVERLMRRNDRFVFFEQFEPGDWPASSLGIPLTSGCTVATDKSVFPAGGIVVVVTGGHVRFMLDQDSGGAILGPGRADIFMGVGESAGAIAGRQNHDGRLYYLLLK